MSSRKPVYQLTDRQKRRRVADQVSKVLSSIQEPDRQLGDDSQLHNSEDSPIDSVCDGCHEIPSQYQPVNTSVPSFSSSDDSEIECDFYCEDSESEVSFGWSPDCSDDEYEEVEDFRDLLAH